MSSPAWRVLGIGIAVPIAATENKVFWVMGGGQYEHLKIPGLVIVAVVMVLLYKLALRKKQASA